ncbi:MAG TPA: SH3 domain-containing protein [Clostridiales bacterium]|nr:SH3 domain-containing protein [Clostridiales bacterium]
MKTMKKIIAIAFMCVLLLPTASVLGQGKLYALVYNTKQLNLRSGPGTNYQWLGALKRGEWVEVLQNYGDWYLVNFIDKPLSGYMSASYLKTASSGSSGSSFTVSNPSSGQYLNLRSFPSYSAPVLGIYYNGAMGNILDVNGNWYHVEIGGKTGYFRGEYLRLGGSGYGSTPATAYAKNGGGINLRSGPGTGNPVLIQVPSGSAISAHLQGNDYWYVTAGGQTGFMDANFIRMGSYVGPSAPTPSIPSGGVRGVVTNTGKRLNLRETASLNARVLGQYHGGTEVRILEHGNEWCRVYIPLTGARGYMMSRYLTVYGTQAGASKRVVHPQGTFVYLRARPSQSTGTIITKVPHGTYVSVIAPQGNWTQVRYGNSVGYMMSWFLK